MAVTSISDEIVCVGYPASSCFSVLAVLNVTTSGSHLPAMLGKYQKRKQLDSIKNEKEEKWVFQDAEEEHDVVAVHCYNCTWNCLPSWVSVHYPKLLSYHNISSVMTNWVSVHHPKLLSYHNISSVMTNDMILLYALLNEKQCKDYYFIMLVSTKGM